MDGPGGVPTTMLFCQPPTASLPCRFHFSYAGQSIQVLPLSSAVLSLYLNKPFYCRRQRSVLLGTCVEPAWLLASQHVFRVVYFILCKFRMFIRVVSLTLSSNNEIVPRAWWSQRKRNANGWESPKDTIDTFHDLSVHD